MTKRSSRSLSRSSSRPPSSQSAGPGTLGRETLATHRDSPSLPTPSRMSHTYSAAAVLASDASAAASSSTSANTQYDVPRVEEPRMSTSVSPVPLIPQLSPPQLSVPSLAPDEESHLRSVSHSSTSTAVDSTPRTPADFAHDEPEQRSLIRIVSLSRQVDSPTTLDDEDDAARLKGKVPELPSHDADIDGDEATLLYGDSAPEDLDHDYAHVPEDQSTTFLDSEPSMRISTATTMSEGETTGFGLTLLQDFVNGDMDDGEAEGCSVHTQSMDDSIATVEGPHETTVITHIDEHGPTHVRSESEAASTRSSSIYSHASRHSRAGSHSHSLSGAPSPRDDVASATDSDYAGEDWEGASDIYDNYRYSRASMASKMSRLSKGSMHTVASGLGIALEAPPPIPTDSRRPSLDSLRHAAARDRERERFGSASASASASVEDVRRTVKVLDTTDPASPAGENADTKEVHTPVTARRIPPPLELASSNYNRLAMPETPSQAGFSPLLHTSFHSPLPSPPGMHSPSYLTPLSSPGTTPLFSNTPGGAASALRQRLELGRASPSPLATHAHLAHPALYEQVDSGRARLSTQPIVVEDNEIVLPMAANDADSTVSASLATSPTASVPSFDAVSEKKRMIETTYFVANQAPPPPYTPMSPTAGSSGMDSQDVFSPHPHSQSHPSSPLPPAIPRPQPSSANAFARRSMFLPHPHAPKPADVPSGPMYGRAPVAASPQASPTGPPPGSLAHALLMALQARADPMRTRPVTIYANFDRELTSSVGPVPVVFSLERQSGRARQGEVSQPQSLPASASQPIPRTNFAPQAQTARPRSSSMSDVVVFAADGDVLEHRSVLDRICDGLAY